MVKVYKLAFSCFDWNYHSVVDFSPFLYFIYFLIVVKSLLHCNNQLNGKKCIELTLSKITFHTVHGVLKARTLKWFAIPFFSGPYFVRTLHHDLSVLGDPTWRGS